MRGGHGGVMGGHGGSNGGVMWESWGGEAIPLTSVQIVVFSILLFHILDLQNAGDSPLSE